MNIEKRIINPLLGRTFRYQQSENASLKYTIKWGPAIQTETISASSWTVERGDAVVSSESFSTAGAATTEAIFSGTPGESTIVNKVTLSGGEVDERIIFLRITDNDIPRYENDYWDAD